jgi:hypothetical protein
MVEIVLERFEPWSRRKPLKEISAIAKDHDRQPSVISNAIVEAFARKLVKIVPQKQTGPTRVPDLERKLEARFQKLHAVRVIKAPTDATSASRDRLEDRTHEELGEAAAGLLANKLIIRDKDVIGIGSGRGVYAVVKALSRFGMLRAHNVTAVSLTGAVYPRSHAYWNPEDNSGTADFNLHFDPDDHLTLLGFSFPPDLKIVKLSCVIAWEPGQLITERSRTILDRDTWKTMVPNLAIVGVGVFSRGHRFFQEVDAPPSVSEKRLTPILGDLSALKKMVLGAVGPLQAERYVPVADVCNRLFYVKPPPDISLSGEKEKQIKDLIKNINGKLLCATEEQLAEIDQLMLVAGTRKKAPAIKQLLKEDKYKIRIICIDQEAAEAILAT